jgi:hypothetical protein
MAGMVVRKVSRTVYTARPVTLTPAKYAVSQILA